MRHTTMFLAVAILAAAIAAQAPALAAPAYVPLPDQVPKLPPPGAAPAQPQGLSTKSFAPAPQPVTPPPPAPVPAPIPGHR